MYVAVTFEHIHVPSEDLKFYFSETRNFVKQGKLCLCREEKIGSDQIWHNQKEIPTPKTEVGKTL